MTAMKRKNLSWHGFVLKNVFPPRLRILNASHGFMDRQTHPDFTIALESVVKASLLLKDRTLFNYAISVSPLKLPCLFYRTLDSNLGNAYFSRYHEG